MKQLTIEEKSGVYKANLTEEIFVHLWILLYQMRSYIKY